MKRVAVNIEEELYKEIRIYLVHEDLSMQKYLYGLILKDLENREKEKE